MREALVGVAVGAAVLGAWHARRGANPPLAAFGGMYALALALFAFTWRGAPWVACVVLHFEAMVIAKTLAIGRARRGTVPFARGVLFLALAPTLDAERAFVPDPSVGRGRAALGAVAGLAEMLAAFAVAGGAARLGVLDAGPYPAAWARMVALYLVLDGFGRTFSGACGVFGSASESAFDRPWLMRDLADLWGRRWNLFVGRTLFHVVYRPWVRRTGTSVAVLATFLASGLLHEILYVIPAGGAFGWYLVFFGLHGFFAAAVSRLSSPLLRRVLSWVIVLATVPLYFGGAFPRAFPLESLFRA